MGASDSPAVKRFVFIDLYRSAVILLMLEGHLVRSVLSADLQRSPWFTIHEFFHGISAPAFLFGAGLTFVISTRRTWDRYHHWGPPLAKRIGRLLLILALGLAIHLPFFSIRKLILEGTTTDYLALFQSDVLACIGLGLLTLHALVFFFKTEERFYGVVLGLTLMFAFLTPLVWDIDFLQFTPPYIAQLCNSMHGSPFPLFPFVGFLFSGVILSWEFLVAVERKRERLFMRNVALLGVCAIAGGLIFDSLPFNIYPTYNFWYTSPNYFFIRIGALLILTAVSWIAAEWLGSTRLSWTLFGRESLFVYVLHLPFIYGSVINPSWDLRTFLGGNHGIPAAIGIFFLFSALMFGCAAIWHTLKARFPLIHRLLQLGGAGWFLHVLFTRDY